MIQWREMPIYSIVHPKELELKSKWPDKYVIGLTGNIATGKSVVRKMLEHLGADPDRGEPRAVPDRQRQRGRAPELVGLLHEQLLRAPPSRNTGGEYRTVVDRLTAPPGANGRAVGHG